MSKLPMGELTPYKNYWISSYALLVSGWGNDWYARSAVSRIEPSGRTVDIKRFEPSEIFASKEEAEAHGLEFARKWVDEQAEMVEVRRHRIDGQEQDKWKQLTFQRFFASLCAI